MSECWISLSQMMHLLTQISRHVMCGSWDSRLAFAGRDWWRGAGAPHPPWQRLHMREPLGVSRGSPGPWRCSEWLPLIFLPASKRRKEAAPGPLGVSDGAGVWPLAAFRHHRDPLCQLGQRSWLPALNLALHLPLGPPLRLALPDHPPTCPGFQPQCLAGS